MAGGVCMIKFKIGLQLYSIRQMAEKDLYETLKRVKALGYDGVELGIIWTGSKTGEGMDGWSRTGMYFCPCSLERSGGEDR